MLDALAASRLPAQRSTDVIKVGCICIRAAGSSAPPANEPGLACVHTRPHLVSPCTSTDSTPGRPRAPAGGAPRDLKSGQIGDRGDCRSGIGPCASRGLGMRNTGPNLKSGVAGPPGPIPDPSRGLRRSHWHAAGLCGSGWWLDIGPCLCLPVRLGPAGLPVRTTGQPAAGGALAVAGLPRLTGHCHWLRLGTPPCQWRSPAPKSPLWHTGHQ